MSHVLEIRRRTAQERLRGDHIDLLFQLENCHRENDALTLEVNRLLEKLSNNENNAIAHPVQVEYGGQDSISIEENLKEEIIGLKNEIKIMKTSFSIATSKMQKESAVSGTNKL
jgi:hypothetical protein